MEEKENVLYVNALAHAKENADAKLPARNANVQLDENAAVDANLDKVDEEKKNNSHILLIFRYSE